jgi:hypothetical protein
MLGPSPPEKPPPYPFPPRNTGFCRGMKLFCRIGHRCEMGERAFDGGSFRCTWKRDRTAPECGEHIVFWIVPKAGGGRRLWAADVTGEEVKYFEANFFDLDQVMEYVGAMRTERRVA